MTIRIQIEINALYIDVFVLNPLVIAQRDVNDLIALKKQNTSCIYPIHFK